MSACSARLANYSIRDTLTPSGLLLALFWQEMWSEQTLLDCRRMLRTRRKALPSFKYVLSFPDAELQSPPTPSTPSATLSVNAGPLPCSWRFWL